MPHASGRPWLVGRWPAGQVVLAGAGPVRVGVIGVGPVTPTRLSELAARVRSVSDVDSLVAALPGSWHVVVSIHGQVRLQGGMTGLRRVFCTRVHGVDVASDRADLLAAMARSGVDEEALAVRLVCGRQLPPPLNERPVWSGISAVPADHCLVWERDRARQLRWWSPPAARQPFEQGVVAVREVLTTAMDKRVPA
ncbi:hypothetical protein [Saccharopolyspora sp. NPDC050642]|uniref:hypothetical protein n=1 Tax=Saccharopolyspora sp. NPDC050642 TaxID=3157099 RepID=UPI0033E72F3E